MVLGCRVVLLGSLQAQTAFILASLEVCFWSGRCKLRGDCSAQLGCCRRGVGRGVEDLRQGCGGGKGLQTEDCFDTGQSPRCGLAGDLLAWGGTCMRGGGRAVKVSFEVVVGRKISEQQN